MAAKDSKAYALWVAFVLCLVCSMLVTAAAIALRPMQQAAKLDDKRKNILRVVGLYQEGMDIDQAFKQITPKVIDLDTGEIVEQIDPATYDQYAAAKDPAQGGQKIPGDADIAKIKYRPRYATVYFLYNADGTPRTVILPISGYGLWSTLYGFLAVEADGNTVVGINFYRHAETPGLGGEVDNPMWKKQWTGKKIYDESGKVALHLVKGGVNPENPEAVHQVDALAGATLTSNGVTYLIQYWLSDAGFKPFLRKLSAQHSAVRTAGGE
ncbi:Na+-transporting NADH:ubiquinone oxidoreductase subunit C [Fontimonas thermophila]|uniref:Na(+)-translocating NADH-quinone reductase subunit C n=1 Tax=Fontimonas thermophila TaxID=1076937 RepID=A0A1I2JYI7_9GAMM|nr:Na(+)-translocating NADH-quinone reductase subunit C [Fontimonas thermophila]SFF58037.1 Na+-transporting NADH:ubiquinone oxidoreductase subunit C [Fontimonas thermophila]